MKQKNQIVSGGNLAEVLEITDKVLTFYEELIGRKSKLIDELEKRITFLESDLEHARKLLSEVLNVKKTGLLC